MRLPFNATYGDVASWRNDHIECEQAPAKYMNFLSLNHLGRNKKIWGGTCLECPPVVMGLH